MKFSGKCINAYAHSFCGEEFNSMRYTGLNNISVMIEVPVLRTAYAELKAWVRGCVKRGCVGALSVGARPV